MFNELDLKSEIAKYEGELSDMNRQLSQLDDRKAQMLRIGVRLEGVIAYLKQKLVAIEADAKKALEAPLAEAKQDISSLEERVKMDAASIKKEI